MKEPSRAPMYACLYPGLCDIARANGYALAIHGSMQTDLDFIAVPWTDEASDPDCLAMAIKKHIGALTHKERIIADGMPEHFADQVEAATGGAGPTKKPHGRLAWSLHLDHGSYIDLSIYPKNGNHRPE